jgi:hypothetical protein
MKLPIAIDGDHERVVFFTDYLVLDRVHAANACYE